jgi:nuclease-like protein
VAALTAAVLVAGAGEEVLAFGLALVSGASALASHRALRLAARSRVGAESEAQVRRSLEQLRREGWRVQHALDWPDGGDLDHVVRVPSGIGFVIETKTLRYTRAHRVRTADAASWLSRRRRSTAPGCFP